MSDLQPKGAVLIFNGEERHLFWDFGVIEKVQEMYGEHPFFAIKKMLWEGKDDDGTRLQHYQAKPLLDLTEILINNDAAREKYFNGIDLRKYTREEIGMLIDRENVNMVVAAIISSWSDAIGGKKDADDDEEEDEKNLTSGQQN